MYKCSECGTDDFRHHRPGCALAEVGGVNVAERLSDREDWSLAAGWYVVESEETHLFFPMLVGEDDPAPNTFGHWDTRTEALAYVAGFRAAVDVYESRLETTNG